MAVIAGVCGVNYLIRLIRFTLLGALNLVPWGWANLGSDPGFLQNLAWFEFGLITAMILIFSAIGLCYILLREGVNFLAGRTIGMTMTANSFWTLVGCLVLACGMSNLVWVKPDTLVGTRAAGLAFPVLMFLATVMSASIAALVLAYLLEPEKMQAAFDRPKRTPKA